jgi:transcriptional regulator with XRE-family HTH domain
MDVNVLLRREREARGWSLDDVADRLAKVEVELGLPPSQTDGHSVGRWERGERTPRPRGVQALCHLYQRRPYELGLGPPEDSEELDVIRREFLRLSGALIGGTAMGLPGTLEPWERLSRAIRQPSRTDVETVRHLEHLTVTFESLEAHASPLTLVRPVSGHLGTITGLLEGTPPSDLRRQLLSLAAESAGLLAWLSWDLGTASRDQARAYVRTALEAARESGDRPLGAYLIGTASVVEHPKGEAEGRLRFLAGEPFGFRLDDASPATRSWLSAIEAEAYALLEREADSRRALDLAQEAWTRPVGESLARPRATFFDAARLAGEQGICLANLGQPVEAQAVLQTSLAELAPDQEKTRPRLVAALGVAHVRQGNVDEACRLGAEALRAATDLQVQPNLQDVLNLRQLLEPWSEAPEVRDLDELLADAHRVA